MIIVFYQCFTLRNPIFRKTNFRNLIMSNNVFEKMCRLCMSQKDKLFPIFGWDSDHKNPVQISDRIMMCASVMVAEGDGLPAQICDGCCLQLDSSYDFRKRCEHSDVTLRELISKCSSFDLEADDVKDLKDILHVSLVEEVKLEPCSSDPQELSASDQASDAADTPDAIAPQEPARPRTKGVRRGRAGSRPHQCAECQKTFTQAGDLQIHRRIHSGERPYVCDTCGKRFPSSSNLARHKRIHTGEKPFACSVCDKSFTVRSALKEHHNVHSGDKRFLCKVCGKSFAQQGNLKIHEMLHTGAKPHVCCVCGRRFALRGNLKDHLNIHSCEKPFSCSTCGKAFTQRSTLKEHLKVHSGEKPFLCPLCSKAFAYRKTLKIHMNIHTGAKPHACQTCSKCFSERSHLKRHMKLHNGL
ncbi:zinc finger protein OZF-like isoform X2 [Bacillus rossius redtenbacheri]|uniref:zinc finger protein OZF-like isoform X2 n=1 Tax=Bacillus rossius redtenbacheri TaxID=93214 RepID=UPI002FDD3CB0